MDAQVKKGLLEYCVLAELQKKESYGYQIIRDLSGGGFRGTDPGDGLFLRHVMFGHVGYHFIIITDVFLYFGLFQTLQLFSQRA